MQKQAGFYVESILDFFTLKQVSEEIKPMFNLLGHYESDTDTELKKILQHPTLCLMRNLIMRALPANASDYIQDSIVKAFGKTEKQVNVQNEIRYVFSDDTLKDKIYRALHLSSGEKQYPVSSDTHQFKDFVRQQFLSRIGLFFAEQLQEKRTYASFSDNADTDKINFADDKIPFLIDLPYLIHGKRGLVIEIEDAENEAEIDFLAFEAKQNFVNRFDFDFVLLKKRDFEINFQKIIAFTYNPYFDILKRDSEMPLSSHESGRIAMQIVHSPAGAAAIQMTLLDYIVSGALNMRKDTWQIAVTEHDVPAAKLAVDDFERTYKQLCILQGREYDLPKIDLTVYASDLFLKSKLHGDAEIKSLTQFDESKMFDLHIDYSAILKDESDGFVPTGKSLFSARIRAAYYIKNNDTFICSSKPVSYQKTIKNIQKPEIQRALDYFMRSVFRFDYITDDQKILLSRILEHDDSIHLNISHKDRELMFGFAALLQSGMTIVISPNALALEAQYTDLRKFGFQKAFYLDSSKLKLSLRENVLRKFSKNQIQICFMTAGQTQSAQIIKLIEESRKNGSYISHVFIDALENVSEFSPDFWQDYGALPSWLQTLRSTKPKIKFTGFSSVFNYSVLSDWMHSFKFSEQDIFEYKNRQNVSLQVIKSDSDTEQGANITQERLSLHYKDKLDGLLGILQNIKDDDNQILIITPGRVGETGILNSENELSADLLAQKTGMKFLNLPALTEFGIASGSSEAVQEAKQNYKTFLGHKADALLSPPANDLNYDKSKLAHIICLNLPSSPAKIQELVSLFPQNDIAKTLTILYDDKEVSTYENTSTTLDDGTVETMEEIHRLSLDVHINKQYLKRLYPGRQKELQIISELLSEITQAEHIPAEIIQKRIADEFGESVELTAQPVKSPYQLHLNSGHKTYGFYDVRTGNINVKYSTFNRRESEQILKFVKQEIQKLYGDNTSFFERLYQKTNKKTVAGIDNLYKRLRIGEEGKISFSPENNVPDKLLDLLEKYLPGKFTKKQVAEALNADDAKTCISQLSDIEDVNLINSDIDLPFEITDAYLKYRNRQFTLNALFRLQSAGIIKNYRIYETRESVELFFKKMPTASYREKLKNFFTRYISASKAEEIVSGAANYPGDSYLQKIVNMLINFVYDYILPAHYDEMTDVNSLVIRRLNAGSDNSFDFAEELLNISRRKYVYDLSAQKNKSALETSVRFMRLVQNDLAKQAHLSASIKSLIKNKPNSAVLNLLKSYNDLLHNAENESVLDENLDSLVAVFADIEAQKKMSFDELIEKKKQYLDFIFNEKPELRLHAEPLLYLKTHSDWLEQFNKHFLTGLNVS